MAKNTNIQSVEPNIADLVNGWLKSYKLDYKLEQESLNTEIDQALNDYFSKNGGKGGMHHIAFAMENTDQALNEAKDKGVRLIDQQSRPGAEGLHIGFLHPKSTLGVLTEFCCK